MWYPWHSHHRMTTRENKGICNNKQGWAHISTMCELQYHCYEGRWSVISWGRGKASLRSLQYWMGTGTTSLLLSLLLMHFPILSGSSLSLCCLIPWLSLLVKPQERVWTLSPRNRSWWRRTKCDVKCVTQATGARVRIPITGTFQISHYPYLQCLLFNKITSQCCRN